MVQAVDSDWWNTVSGTYWDGIILASNGDKVGEYHWRCGVDCRFPPPGFTGGDDSGSVDNGCGGCAGNGDDGSGGGGGGGGGTSLPTPGVGDTAVHGFWTYGNWCGTGGTGRPIDAT